MPSGTNQHGVLGTVGRWAPPTAGDGAQRDGGLGWQAPHAHPWDSRPGVPSAAPPALACCTCAPSIRRFLRLHTPINADQIQLFLSFSLVLGFQAQRANVEARGTKPVWREGRGGTRCTGGPSEAALREAWVHRPAAHVAWKRALCERPACSTAGRGPREPGGPGGRPNPASHCCWEGSRGHHPLRPVSSGSG